MTLAHPFHCHIGPKKHSIEFGGLVLIFTDPQDSQGWNQCMSRLNPDDIGIHPATDETTAAICAPCHQQLQDEHPELFESADLAGGQFAVYTPSFTGRGGLRASELTSYVNAAAFADLFPAANEQLKRVTTWITETTDRAAANTSPTSQP